MSGPLSPESRNTFKGTSLSICSFHRIITNLSYFYHNFFIKYSKSRYKLSAQKEDVSGYPLSLFLPETSSAAEKEERFVIEVKNLVKRYGDHTAVDHLSFQIEKGKIYGFLGPNGAGKSTTMNIITGCIAST